jgi:hypothetical protein
MDSGFRGSWIQDSEVHGFRDLGFRDFPGFKGFFLICVV